MKIALIGYGKMGKTIEQIAIQRGHQIVSIIDINNAEDIYSEAFKSADAAIEFTTPATAFNNYMNVLSDFIVRVNAEFPETIENEELNSLLTTIKNQGEEIAELHKEVDKLQAKAEKAAKTVKAEPKAAPKKAAAKKPAAKKATAKKED